jgi:hypothetical protein
MRVYPARCYTVMLLRVLLGVGDEQIAIDILDVERREASRDTRIDKASIGGRRLVVVVKNIDRAASEIGGVDKVAVDVDTKGEVFVCGTSPSMSILR